MELKSVSVEIGGRTMTFETGVMAKQADGAVVVRMDDSAVRRDRRSGPIRLLAAHR